MAHIVGKEGRGCTEQSTSGEVYRILLMQESIIKNPNVGIDYKKLRETAGLDETALANELGVTPELVIGWETGIIAPSVNEQNKIFALVKKITERGRNTL